jgi:hypothetical protein
MLLIHRHRMARLGNRCLKLIDDIDLRLSIVKPAVDLFNII